MFYVKVGYYGDACDVCGEEQGGSLLPLRPMVVIVVSTPERRMIIAHRECLMKHLNEAIEKFDEAIAKEGGPEHRPILTDHTTNGMK